MGIYERTLGALTALPRGEERTPEDEFALRLLDDYAAFLRQTPWFRYPFGSELVRFWKETPLTGGNPVRKIERRLALTLEYATKAVYAKAIGWLAGYSPADLQIMSVVDCLDEADLAADWRIRKVADVGNEYTLIETPRYQEFTEIVRGLGARGHHLSGIAGNRRVLVTVLTRSQAALEALGAQGDILHSGAGETRMAARWPGCRRRPSDRRDFCCGASSRGIRACLRLLERVPFTPARLRRLRRSGCSRGSSCSEGPPPCRSGLPVWPFSL
jgi:hypothetical protein